MSRHIKTWTQVQQNIASERSTAAPSITDQAHTADSGHGQNTGDAETGSDYRDDDEYAQVGTDRDYVGASR